MTRVCGEANGQAKLTENDVRKIRSMKRTHTVKEISEEFGMGKSPIRRILNGKAWKGIEPIEQFTGWGKVL